MTNGTRTDKKRFTVGLLISNISDIYTRQIWPGVADTLRKRDINLIVFCGNPFFSGSSLLYRHYGQNFSQQAVSSFDYQSNIMYELIGQESVDALILTTGSLIHSVSDDRFMQFLNRVRTVPVVSIAIRLDGTPSVLVDNRKGMQDTVNHLIEAHGCRRIAFIRGPENHREAEERYQAYLDSLELHDIAPDKNLVTQGDFMWHSGSEAAMELIDNRKIPFDAVVAANDSMAISAMTFLQSRGLRVPGDVAVAGFDNIELAKYTLTPLSTVRQPFYQQASMAAEIAADLLEGKNVPETVVLPAEFVSRSSCGCLPEPIEMNSVHHTARVAGDAAFRLYSGQETENEETKKLADLFRKLVDEKESPDNFLQAINEAALMRFQNGDDARDLLTTLTRIKNSVIATLAGTEDILRCERHYQDAVIYIGEKSQIVPGLKLIDYINSDTLLVSVMQGILSKIQISELLDTIVRELPRLNIPGCAISLYEKPWRHDYLDAWNIPGEIELVMSYNKGGRNDLPAEKRKYPTDKLIPDEFLYADDKCFTLIAEALYFAEEQLGLILFEQGNTEGMVYELLRLQISNAVKGSLMLHQQQLIQKDLQNHILTMDSELDLARKIQFGLIPQKSNLQNVSFYYKPMAKVGGDFFDFISFRNPDLTGFFISDVSGHGVPAALVTSMIKTTLLQIASPSNSPSQVLRQLNHILISQSANNFITAFYGILNRKKRELEYSFAGHNSPLLISDGGIAPLPSSGKALPLAILDNHALKEIRREYIDQKIELEEGSKLFLYTDGLTEAVNVTEKKTKDGPSLKDFESSELLNEIEKHRNLPSREFVEKITAKLRDFRGSEEYEDDVCIICVDIL